MAMSTCHRKNASMFLRPKGILQHSNRLKGVMMPVFAHPLGWQDLRYPFPRSNLEKTEQLGALAAKSRLLAEGRCPAILPGWAGEIHHRDASCHAPSSPCVASWTMERWTSGWSCLLPPAWITPSPLPTFCCPVLRKLEVMGSPWVTMWVQHHGWLVVAAWMSRPSLPAGGCRPP